MVKGDKFIVGLAKFPSFRRRAISINDIQKIDLWCWPPPEVDLSEDSDPWFWMAIARRYRGPIIIFIWDKSGKKYKNIVANIALFKGLINKMKNRGNYHRSGLKTNLTWLKTNLTWLELAG